MALKSLAALTVAVMLAPAAHAEPAPENSEQEPVVRPVFNQPTNVPGKSLEAVSVSYPLEPRAVPTTTRNRRSSWRT